jgi:hypothetical protein
MAKTATERKRRAKRLKDISTEGRARQEVWSLFSAGLVEHFEDRL